MAAAGYFADFESLLNYCRGTGCPVAEIDGLAVVQPYGKHGAGDPLHRQGDHQGPE